MIASNTWWTWLDAMAKKFYLCTKIKQRNETNWKFTRKLFKWFGSFKIHMVMRWMVNAVCGCLNLWHFVTSFASDYVKYTIVYRLSMAYHSMHTAHIYKYCVKRKRKNKAPSIKIIIICIRSTYLCKLIFLCFFLRFSQNVRVNVGSDMCVNILKWEIQPKIFLKKGHKRSILKVFQQLSYQALCISANVCLLLVIMIIILSDYSSSLSILLKHYFT